MYERLLVLCRWTQWCTVIALETTEFWAVFFIKNTKERGEGTVTFFLPLPYTFCSFLIISLSNKLHYFGFLGGRGLRLALTTLQL